MNLSVPTNAVIERAQALGTIVSDDAAPAANITPAATSVRTDYSAAPGPIVAVGSAVTCTYTVTNSSGVTLTNVTVTDNKVAAAAIHCGSTTGSNVIANLASNATAICGATGPAIAGQYANIDTVTAATPGSGLLAATDTSY